MYAVFKSWKSLFVSLVKWCPKPVIWNSFSVGKTVTHTKKKTYIPWLEMHAYRKKISLITAIQEDWLKHYCLVWFWAFLNNFYEDLNFESLWKNCIDSTIQCANFLVVHKPRALHLALHREITSTNVPLSPSP